MVPVDDKEVEAGVAEIVEIGPRRIFGIQAFMVGENLLDDGQRPLHLFRRRVVGDADVHDALDEGPASDVVGGGVHHLGIGYGHVVAVQPAQLDRAQAHLLHRAVVAVEHYSVPDGEGLVQHDHKKAEKIFDGVLGAEGHGDARDPQAADDGGHALSGDALEKLYGGEDDYAHLQDPLDERHQHIVQAGIGLHRPLGQNDFDDPHEIIDKDDQSDIDEDTGQPDRHGGVLGVEEEARQPDKARPDQDAHRPAQREDEGTDKGAFTSVRLLLKPFGVLPDNGSQDFTEKEPDRQEEHQYDDAPDGISLDDFERGDRAQVPGQPADYVFGGEGAGLVRLIEIGHRW